MTTLFDMLYSLARSLEASYEGEATGGSATTLVDSQNGKPDDYWNNGFLYLTSGTRAGASLKVSDWANTTHTFTVASGLTLAAGDAYLATLAKWPRSELVRAINRALEKQQVQAWDESLGVVAGQLDYSLPAGISHVLRVEVGNDTDDTNGWEAHVHWHEADGELRFNGHVPDNADDAIRLTYLTQPAAVAANTDAINDQVDLELLRLDGLALLHEWRFNYAGKSEPGEKDDRDRYIALAERRRMGRAPKQKDPRYARWTV